MNIVIAECPDCGQQYFGADEDNAKEKYKGHICLKKLPDNIFRKLANDMIQNFGRQN